MRSSCHDVIPESDDGDADAAAGEPERLPRHVGARRCCREEIRRPGGPVLVRTGHLRQRVEPGKSGVGN
jgi:hypothetical protein